MATGGLAFFDTALGLCGVAWGASGLRGLLLPEEGGASATRARLARQFPALAEVAEPPAPVCEAMIRVAALLSGTPDDLADIVLDMTGVSPFHQRVYAATRAIRPGQTSTYGEVAVQLGEPGAARAVGQALGQNPFAPVVPCHRVLAAGARSGGFSAGGGVATKLRMLQREGACLGGQPGLFDGGQR